MVGVDSFWSGLSTSTFSLDLVLLISTTWMKKVCLSYLTAGSVVTIKLTGWPSEGFVTSTVQFLILPSAEIVLAFVISPVKSKVRTITNWSVLRHLCIHFSLTLLKRLVQSG